jgi:hypothetical protein
MAPLKMGFMQLPILFYIIHYTFVLTNVCTDNYDEGNWHI